MRPVYCVAQLSWVSSFLLCHLYVTNFRKLTEQVRQWMVVIASVRLKWVANLRESGAAGKHEKTLIILRFLNPVQGICIRQKKKGCRATPKQSNRLILLLIWLFGGRGSPFLSAHILYTMKMYSLCRGSQKGLFRTVFGFFLAKLTT